MVLYKAAHNQCAFIGMVLLSCPEYHAGKHHFVNTAVGSRLTKGYGSALAVEKARSSVMASFIAALH